jgi:hypothetical protein
MTTERLREVTFALAALAAFLFIVARAHIQAITIDEAITYTGFVMPAEPYYLQAHGNNHILNSILMRAATRTLGVSNLTVRAGALTGAAIYIASAYFLCAWIFQPLYLRLLAFTCLVWNPMVLDYLVAARGYGLASAFLLAALAIVAHRKTPQACAAASICLALSVVANFSFAIVDTAILPGLWLWIRTPKSALALTIPGLAVGLAIAGPALKGWDRSDMVYGASSLKQTFQSVEESSVYESTPRLTRWMTRRILPFAALAVLYQLFRTRAVTPQVQLAIIAAAALTAALLIHQLLYTQLKIPLPLDRTAIYIAILITLAATAIATSRVLQLALTLIAIYFLTCTRVMYFKEWKWDADTDTVYEFLAHYNQTCALKDVSVNWRYDASLNFYRETSQNTLAEFPSGLAVYPPGKPAYVLHFPEDQQFVDDHGLNVVYRKILTGTVIALDPQSGCK